MVAALKARAARNHRSLQGELMVILESAVDDYPVLTASRVAQIACKVKAINVPTTSDIVQMIREDRDGDHH